ncbi:hypothetical protein FPV67DRAFT_1447228 [Lyophyllum atratum]|nr:hypothetical protein FPV67DRAFT_1447228 [Lyophyllum atratum]
MVVLTIQCRSHFQPILLPGGSVFDTGTDSASFLPPHPNATGSRRRRTQSVDAYGQPPNKCSRGDYDPQNIISPFPPPSPPPPPPPHPSQPPLEPRPPPPRLPLSLAEMIPQAIDPVQMETLTSRRASSGEGMPSPAIVMTTTTAAAAGGSTALAVYQARRQHDVHCDERAGAADMPTVRDAQEVSRIYYPYVRDCSAQKYAASHSDHVYEVLLLG